MAIDYSVVFECEPKRYFGQGDCGQGTLSILEALKSKNRAAALRQMVEQAGKDPATAVVKLHVHDQDGNPIEKQATLADLEAHGRMLAQKGVLCTACPANFLGQPYGCCGAINYPIPETGETWLLSRLQPFGTIGAQMCLDFLKQFKVTGESVLKLRQSDFFESKTTPSVALKKSLFSKISVTSDQILQTILHAGNPLAPADCFGLLLWLGAIRVDEKIPTELNDQVALFALGTPQAKQQHTRLELGDQSSDAGVSAFQTLVMALYLCWLLDAPLWISP
jgi:hypothetical protein